MWGIMHVWDCPNCGPRLDDEIIYHSSIDINLDSSEKLTLCDDCGADVQQRFGTGTDGQKIPVMESVDDERMRAFAYGDYYEDDGY